MPILRRYEDNDEIICLIESENYEAHLRTYTVYHSYLNSMREHKTIHEQEYANHDEAMIAFLAEIIQWEHCYFEDAGVEIDMLDAIKKQPRAAHMKAA